MSAANLSVQQLSTSQQLSRYSEEGLKRWKVRTRDSRDSSSERYEKKKLLTK